ncbi:MAG: histidine triad (HIT) family protein [Saprospiraceae bacterium]|jgi:histidine triad (HIT) family protein
MSSIFTKIINGDIPCYKIAETEDYFAFLDIRPLAKGHTLCVPKQETDYIFDLEDDVLSGLSIFSKRVAKAIEAVVECKRVGVLVVGTEVPHAHVHLIPFQTEGQMSVKSKPIKIEKEEMQVLAAAIADFF